MLRQMLLLALILALVGCAPSTPTPNTQSPVPDSTTPESVDAALALGDFTIQINNPYLPLTPGLGYLFEGSVDGRPYRIERYVMLETRTITDVECVVMRETASTNGTIIQETAGCYAQSAEGDVWIFSETDSDGDSWEAGVDGAAASLAMPAFPSTGDVYYPHGADSSAQVLSITEAIQIPFGAFETVLKTLESSAQAAGYAEHRYYAQGIGLVMVEIVEGGEGRVEFIELQVAPPSP